MGYLPPFHFEDASSVRWTGVVRPGIVDLVPLFRRVVEIEVASLLESGAAAQAAWRRVVPSPWVVKRLFAPYVAELVWCPDRGKEEGHSGVKDEAKDDHERGGGGPADDAAVDGAPEESAGAVRTVGADEPAGGAGDSDEAVAPLVRRLVLKALPPRTARGLALMVKRTSRAQRADLWAYRLRSFGIESPRPLGYVQMRRSPERAFSFRAYEFLAGVTLAELRDARFQATGLGLGSSTKAAVGEQLAALVRSLHAQGIFHGDLHAKNILVTKDGMALLDLESIRTFWASRRRMVIKNLVRLNRDFLDLSLVTRTDRMRFLQTYLQHEADRDAGRRALWRRVQVATEVKLRARGESFLSTKL